MKSAIYAILRTYPCTSADVAEAIGCTTRQAARYLAEMVAERSAVRMQGPGPVYRADVFPPRHKEIRMNPMSSAERARVILASGAMPGPRLRAMLGIDDMRFTRLVDQEVGAGRIVRIPKPAPLAAWYGLPDGA